MRSAPTSAGTRDPTLSDHATHRSASVSSAGGTMRSAPTSAGAACAPSHSTGAHSAWSAEDAHDASAAAAASSESRQCAAGAVAANGAAPARARDVMFACGDQRCELRHSLA